MRSQEPEQYLLSKFEEIRKRFRCICSKNGKFQIHEDVFQDYCVNILENKGKRQTLDQFFIDYCRKHKIVNKRYKGPCASDFISIDAFNAPGSVHFIDIFDREVMSHENLSLLNSLYESLWPSLTVRDRDIFRKFLEGHLTVDIAHDLNVSPGLISQKIIALKEHLRELYIKEDLEA